MEGKADRLLEAMIAATARLPEPRVATRNEKDFDLLRVDLIQPVQRSFIIRERKANFDWTNSLHALSS